MRNLFTKAAGWRSLGVVGIVLVLTSASSPAAREIGRRREPKMVPLSESARFRSGEWIRVAWEDREDGMVVDVELDGLLLDMGRRGGVILDRESMAAMAERILGSDTALEDRRAAELLDRVRRVRIRLEGMSIPLGRRALRRVLDHVATSDTPLEDLPVSELIDGLVGLELTADGAPGWFDEPTLVALLGRGLGKEQRAERARDADFARRRAFRLQYADAVSALRKARRDNAGTKQAIDGIYQYAHDVLAANDQLDAVPLLDLQLEMEQELQRTSFRSMSRAERIALRLETRRRMFGDDISNLLFTRDEAMERYELDRLGLEADPGLSALDRRRKLRERREALKVELAKQGVYVSFPDEYRGRQVADVAEAEPDPYADAGQEGGQQ